MAKVFKITTATVNVVVTETYNDEYAAFVGEDGLPIKVLSILPDL